MPNECCGLLIGVDGRIVRSAAATNLAPGSHSYLINPADHFAAIRSARAEGYEVIGAYHSHPGAAATPSRRDVAEAMDAAFIYLIVSIGLQDGIDVRAYRIADELSHEVKLSRVSARGTDFPR
jgi:proteasome lid subunit RPN8/RPN11